MTVAAIRLISLCSLLSCSLSAAGDASASTDILGCFEQLPLPGYGLFARLGNPGTVVITFKVGPKGLPENVMLATDERGLRAEVADALTEVRLKTSCIGHELSLKMIFELVGKPVETPFPKIYFSPPATFRIVSRPSRTKVFVHEPIIVPRK